MSELKQEIMQILKQPILGSLATITDEQKPWVRYVILFTDDEMKIRVATFLNARKVQQIKANPEVHLCCGVNDIENWQTYLQIQGHATITTDQKEKDNLWDPHFAEIFTGPDDPNYMVIIIEPYRIEYYQIGKAEPRIWEKAN